MTNEIEKSGEQPFQLDLTEFTEQEQLVARLILTQKLQGGLEARVGGLIASKMMSENNPFTDEEAIYFGQLDKSGNMLAGYRSSLYNEIADALGVSRERQKYITEWVYKNEVHI